VDCGVLTETLLESELFGHVRGAFTGAVTDKKGMFEEAQGGLMKIDDIEGGVFSEE
jgi:two-component system response regulator HydG